MRIPVMAGNWKMYKNRDEALELINGLIPQVKDAKNVEVLVCPAAPVLEAVNNAIKDSNIVMGGQNLYPKVEGAYTGENSASMLKSVGCKYVIIGHSERREYFSEDDSFLNEKAKTALESSLIPIVCCGESLDQRESGDTNSIIGNQIKGAFKDIPADQAAGMIVAYEPIWAIGTGKTATPELAQETHKAIRDLLAEIYDTETSEKIRIQYGGSVKPGNVDEIMAMKDIDGALVGGASLTADSFARIVNFK